MDLPGQDSFSFLKLYILVSFLELQAAVSDPLKTSTNVLHTQTLLSLLYHTQKQPPLSAPSNQSRMASFSNLCWELKDEIWGLIKQDAVQGGKPLSCLSLVCRDWQRNIEPLFYKELCIEHDGNSVTTFIKTINYSRLHYLLKLTIIFYWPFTRDDIDRKEALRYLKYAAQQICKVLTTLKAVENGQQPHLKLIPEGSPA